MKLYFAPMEGITNYIYRNTHAEMFGFSDGYYAPFITPSDNEKINKKGLKDVVSENNIAKVTVQVLTKDSEAFLKFAKKIKAEGFSEINLNLGCPYPTVVKKGKGAGFLAEPIALDEFLYQIFEKCDIDISIKTRAGFHSADELDALMEIYNKYSISLLVIHPRAREDFYKGEPDMEAFKRAYLVSKNKICYNGNIFSKEDFCRIEKGFSSLDSVMIGRGAVENPAIFREIRGGEVLKTEELILFSERLIENYRQTLRSDVFTMHKMKELWAIMMGNFPDEKKIAKAIKKANTVEEFMGAIKLLPEIKNAQKR